MVVVMGVERDKHSWTYIRTFVQPVHCEEYPVEWHVMARRLTRGPEVDA